MRFHFSKIFKMLNPPAMIGGLAVSNTALRFLLLEDGKISKTASVNLPAGTLDSGKILNSKNFLEALKNLRSQISPPKRLLPVIISLPSANIYTQIFNLPFLETSHLEEAALLNLQMISPLKREVAYNDWQIVGETASGNHEVLGAFIDSAIVDDLVMALKKSGFLPVALEFSALSLARFLKERSQLDLTQPHLVLNLGEGIDFSVIHEGNLYFNHFISWPSTEQVTFEELKKTVAVEIKKILSLYGNRWEMPLSNVLLISSQPTKEIGDWLQREFALKTLAVDRYQELDSGWFAAMGSALRGLMNRAEDRFISLTRVGTEEEFLRNRVWRFFSIWRTAIFSVTKIVLVSFLVLDLILIRINNKLLNELGGTRVPVNQQEITSLEIEAKNFNDLLEKALIAKKQSPHWSPFLTRIYIMAGNKISITQLDFNPAAGIVNLAGNSKNEQSILDFKNALIKEPNFSEVNLPLSAIVPSIGGVSLFSTTFKLKLP